MTKVVRVIRLRSAENGKDYGSNPHDVFYKSLWYIDDIFVHPLCGFNDKNLPMINQSPLFACLQTDWKKCEPKEKNCFYAFLILIHQLPL